MKAYIFVGFLFFANLAFSQVKTAQPGSVKTATVSPKIINETVNLIQPTLAEVVVLPNTRLSLATRASAELGLTRSMQSTNFAEQKDAATALKILKIAADEAKSNKQNTTVNKASEAAVKLIERIETMGVSDAVESILVDYKISREQLYECVGSSKGSTDVPFLTAVKASNRQ